MGGGFLKTLHAWPHPELQAALDRRSRASAISFRELIPMTSQSEAPNCDLNVLVRRFGVGPLLRPVSPEAFGVYDADLDLQSALQTVSDAEAAFMSLPAAVRKRFNNDPLELLASLHDESKREELEELGILKERPKKPTAPSDAPPPAAIPPVSDRGKGGQGEGPSVQSPK